MGHQLAGSSISVLGFADLERFCEQLSGFQTNILVCENLILFIPSKYSRVDINTLFSATDAVVLHIHSTDENKTLLIINYLQDKKTHLINTSRGDIVNGGYF